MSLTIFDAFLYVIYALHILSECFSEIFNVLFETKIIVRNEQVLRKS